MKTFIKGGKGSAPNTPAREEDINLFEKELAEAGAFELDMAAAYNEPKLWDLLSLCDIDEEMSSRLLRFFLDPSEPHGLKDAFLCEFFNLLQEKLSFKLNIDTANLKIMTERPAGYKGKDEPQTNYVDITIYNPKQYIIHIENKIKKNSIRPEQIKHEMHQAKNKYKVEKIVMIILSPNFAIYESNFKEEAESISLSPNEVIISFYWNQEIIEAINTVLNAQAPDYTLQALLHFKNFCLKIGGNKNE